MKFKIILVLLAVFFMTSTVLQAQITYNITHHIDAGNPNNNLCAEQDHWTYQWTYYPLSNLNNHIWSAPVPIPFDFYWYGEKKNSLFVSRNGILTFDTQGIMPVDTNTNLPSNQIPDNSILTYWDNVYLGTGSDDFYVKTFGTAPNRQLWIKWDWSHKRASNVRLTYGIVLEEGTGNIYVVDFNEGNNPQMSATIGIQRDTLNAVQFGTDNLTTTYESSWRDYQTNDYYQITPSIGNDVALASIESPDSNIGTNNQQNIDIKILNNGQNTLTTSDIYWSINDSLPQLYQWTGSLANNAYSAPITIGNYNFKDGLTDLKIWVSQPNGVLDSLAMNDTISRPICRPLSGTYTIGNSSSNDFQSFRSLARTLHECGVSGPVEFLIDAGVYTENFALLSIAGADSINRVTFNGVDKSLVTITYDGSDATDTEYSFQSSTVGLSRADYVTFKNIKFELLGTNNNIVDVIYILRKADYLLIDNCEISSNPAISSRPKGIRGEPYSSDARRIYAVTVRNTLFSGLSTGFYTWAAPSGNNGQIDIQDNHFIDCETRGIHLHDVDTAIIAGNVIESTHPFSIGINVAFSKNITIEQNYVRADGGISLTGGAYNHFVTNNVVTTKQYSAFSSSANHIILTHNTFYSENAPAANISEVSNSMVVKNNIFASKNDYAYECEEDVLNFNNYDHDYNVYYRESPGSLLYFEDNPVWGGMASLAVWKAFQNKTDSFSVEGDPLFFSTLDLHTGQGAGVDMGDTTAGVLVDFDGNPRPLGNGYDAGAYEYVPISRNLIASELTAPNSPFAEGNQDVYMTIRNVGEDTITNFDLLWSANNSIPNSQSWTGQLLPNDTVSVLVTNYNFQFGETHFKIWTNLPNGLPDEAPENDTLWTTLRPALGGIYTIGNNNAHFLNFNEAIDALEISGMVDSVKFEVQPGIYNENIVIETYEGHSASHPIIFDGLNMDSVKLMADTLVADPIAIKINHTNYITIRNLTIENQEHDNYARGIRIIGSPHINIENNRIILDTSSSHLLNAIGILSELAYINGTPTNSDHINIIGNTILGGTSALSFFSNTNYYDDNNVIVNNTIQNTWGTGIYVVYQEKVDINDNVINQMNHNGSAWYNVGIHMKTTKNATVINNKVDAVNQALLIEDSYKIAWSNSTRMYFHNNFFSSFGSNALGAVEIGPNPGYDFFHNTVYCKKGIAFGGGGGSGVKEDIRNNIFVADDNFAYASFANLSVNYDVLDYNIYHRKTPGGLIKNQYTIYNHLSYWDTPWFNTHSIEGDPLLKSDKDLHIISGAAYDAGDTSLPILTDIDGDLRPATPANLPDIGADEMSPFSDDAFVKGIFSPQDGSCGSTSADIQVVIGNHGLNTITSVPITVLVTSKTGQTTLNITPSVNLNIATLDTILVGNIPAPTSGIFEIQAFVNLPNDENVLNDTALTVISLLDTVNFITHNDTICKGYIGTLTSDLTDGVIWLDDVEGRCLSVEDSFSLSPPYHTTYYAKATLDEYSVADFDVPAGGFNSWWDFNKGLRFDVKTPLLIDSVTVYPEQAGQINVVLYDDQNTAIDTQRVYVNPLIPYEETRIAVGMYVPVGNDWSITASGSTVNRMYRYFPDTLEAQFPFSVPGVVDIKMGYPTNSNTALFYFFFDWSIKTVACNSVSAYLHVNLNPIITTGIVTDISCNGGNDGTISVVMGGGTAPFKFNWLHGDSTQTISNLSIGDYTLEIRDANQCTTDSLAIYNITEPDTIWAIVDTTLNILCFGEATGLIDYTIQGGIPPYNFNWNGGTIGSVPDNVGVLAAGTYNLTLTDANGCIDTLSAVLTEPNMPLQMMLSIDLDTAGQGVGQSTAIVFGGTPPFNYQWGANAGNQTAPTATGLSTGEFEVVVTDANGCFVVDTAMIYSVNTSNFTTVEKLSIYPNPTSDFFEMVLTLSEATAVTLDIYDGLGRRVRQLNYENSQQLKDVIDVSDLVSGMYWLKITNKNGAVLTTKKLLID